jgi:type IV secretory pathway VirB4 component
MPEDTFTPGKLVAWDLSRWMADPSTRVPLTSYLLQRLTGALDKNPTLIVLEEAFSTLETPIFSARIAGWCDYLSQNNAAVIFSTDDIEKAALYPFAPTLAAKAPTLIAMADAQPGAGYTMGFGLTPEDVASLGFMDKANRHIMLKRGGQAAVIKGALSSLPPATLQTLSGRVTASTPSPADTLAELMGYTKKAV